MNHDRAYDIVVYGASGFTGGLVAEYLAKHGGQLRWALAGRDAVKLERVRERLHAPSPPGLIVAEASDDGALRELAQKTRVVLTTVGPYVRYGEPLVRACAEAGTHYVDLTGEPPFVDLVQERYHARAAETRAKIVNACGFDSIPHDLGAWFTLQALRRKLSEQERATLPIRIEGVVRAKGTISGGTWHSALEIMGSMRKAQKSKKTPSPEGRKVGSLPQKISYRKDLGLYAIPMPTIDPLVVLHSARLLPEYGPDFRYGHYFGLKHGYQVAGMFAGVGTVAALAQLQPTRALLEKLKSPGEGPDEATRARSWFRVHFRGTAGPHTVSCEVRGGDPGYSETAKMIAESALCLALDGERLPPHYGVVPTAASMGDALVERLMRAGISFEETTTRGRERSVSEAQATA